MGRLSAEPWHEVSVLSGAAVRRTPSLGSAHPPLASCERAAEVNVVISRNRTAVDGHSAKGRLPANLSSRSPGSVADWAAGVDSRRKSAGQGTPQPGRKGCAAAEACRLGLFRARCLQAVVERVPWLPALPARGSAMSSDAATGNGSTRWKTPTARLRARDKAARPAHPQRPDRPRGRTGPLG